MYSRRRYPSQKVIRELFAYCPSGKLIRKTGKRKTGFDNGDGRQMIAINKVRYYTHVLIFIYHFGYRPPLTDHINRNLRDNRIENLRAADNKINSWNQKLAKNNTSGVKGVYPTKSGTYRVFIGNKNTAQYLGSYKTFQEAVRARKSAELEYFGEVLDACAY